MTAQGHRRTIFNRAIEHGNFMVAEATVREIGHVSLEEALALTALAAQKAPERHRRYAVRWLRRLLEERPSVTIEEALLAAQALAALGGPAHDAAYAVLKKMIARRLPSRADPCDTRVHNLGQGGEE